MVSYLIQGRVAPFYEPVEIGMAEKSVAAAIGRAYGVQREDVLKLYGKLGDLGKVAEQLSAISHQPSAKVAIKEVFDRLKEIAAFSGDGTVEKKISTLTDLLSKVDGVEAKHLVRIPLGT